LHARQGREKHQTCLFCSFFRDAVPDLTSFDAVLSSITGMPQRQIMPEPMACACPAFVRLPKDVAISQHPSGAICMPDVHFHRASCRTGQILP
jgi:hypothetical protein